MNKEEIEKAKENLSFMNEGDYITKEMENSARVLEGYIRKLEKAKEESYWKGYIQKQKEAEEICKMCKYRKRYKELTEKESILDKVTEECRKQMTTYEDSILEIFPEKLLNIIEGDKK